MTECVYFSDPDTKGLTCRDLFNCCDCGGNTCGCRYCFSCNACKFCNPADSEEP